MCGFTLHIDCLLRYRIRVTPEVAEPPAEEVTVTLVGWFKPVKIMLYVPGTGGLAGPMTPVQGLPVAGLLMFRVQVSLIPGVESEAFTVSAALLVRYVAAVIVTESIVGFTVIGTLAVALRPETELLAVTANDSVLGADSGGTIGAANTCCAPFVPATGVSVTPCGASHVYVSVPPAGSMPLALRVTFTPLATGLAGATVALTDGGAGAAGGAIGTETVAIAGVVEFAPPTLTWNVRLVAVATFGATNVVVIADGVFSVTPGLLPLLTCVQANGPLFGVLPAALNVTSVPATIGVAAEVKFAVALAVGGGVPPPVPSFVHVTLGADAPGHGFN